MHLHCLVFLFFGFVFLLAISMQVTHISYCELIDDVQNYLRLESTLSVTNEIRALALDACSRLVYPLCIFGVKISLLSM